MTQRNLLKTFVFRESFPDRKIPAVKILEVGVQLSCWVVFAFLKIPRRWHALYCLAASSQTAGHQNPAGRQMPVRCRATVVSDRW